MTPLPKMRSDRHGLAVRTVFGRRHRWLTPSVRFAVAVGLLVFLFSKIPATQVLVALSSVHGPHLVAGLGITFAIQLILAARLAIVAGVQRISVTLGRAVEIDLSAAFYALFVPGGNLSRAAIRAYKLARPPGNALGSVASIVFDRLVAMFALGVVGQVFWVLERPPEMIPVWLAFLATWAAPVGLYVAALSGRRETATPGGRAGGWLSERWARIKGSVRRFRDMRARTLLATVAASVVVHLLSVLLYLTLASSLEIEISFVSVGWISTATTLLTMLPVTASGLGLREGALVYLLGFYGVSGAAAIALSFLFFAMRFLLTGLLGGLIEVRRWLLGGEP